MPELEINYLLFTVYCLAPILEQISNKQFLVYFLTVNNFNTVVS
jgi:hypothetical protein